MSNAGDYLGDKFRILEILTGGMGEVYICDWLDNERGGPHPQVALKTFQQRFFFDQATRLSFIREASAWLRLSGLPHILPVLGIEQIDGRPFLLMMAVKRGPRGERSIADLLHSGPLASPIALKYTFQLALALHLAGEQMKGLAHGDLKPANVLLMNGDAFLADFGLASAVTLGRADSRLQSTWGYRAPELWGSERNTPNVRSDVYAFGTLVFEMLCGYTPFGRNAHDQATWEQAHQSLKPETPARFSRNPLAIEVMQLALVCLAKKPEERPGNFNEVLDALNQIYEKHDPMQHLMLLMRARELKSNLENFPGFLETRIAGLLEIDEPAQALEELTEIPQDQYSPILWLRRGTALSLLHRDSEALESFQRAESGDLSPEDKVNCRVEFALSLKRLGRFQEAQEIYEQLLTCVSDKQLPLVIINLATVYLQQKRGSETVHLLEPFVRRNPDSAHAWANLGQAYVFVKRYKDAERAYGRALVAAPHEGRVRTMLAALYMDHLWRLEDAWAALDAAFDSGYEGREWLVRMLACSVLLQKSETISALMHGLRNNFEENFAQSVMAEADALVHSLRKQYSGGASHAPVKSPEEPVDEESPARDDARASAQNPAAASLPFLNFRFYETLDFTLDFYDSPSDPNFLDRFLNEWRRAMRDPRIAVEGASLRGSPFYFTRCPNCDVYVLTNRDVGYRISCRMCDTRWQTDPKTGREFEPLLEQVSDAIGIRRPSKEPMVFALWVQPSEESSLGQIDSICTEAGFERWRNDTLLAIHLLQNALKSGAQPQNPWGMWVLETTPSEFWAKGATPREVASIVRKIHTFDSHARTISTELPLDDARSMSKTAEEVEAQLETASRHSISEGRATASDYRNVANAMAHRGELNEAERYARAAVAADEQSAKMWETLGLILFKREDLAGACQALERAVAIDPGVALTLQALSICHARLGNANRARELQLRANSMSAGEFQG